MVVREVRMHPFAGFEDKSQSFQKGMNIVLGKNEFGKTTIFNAIHAALFIPVNIDGKTTDAKWLEGMFPVKGGDYITVTLVFEASGVSYQLRKTWSMVNRNRSCELTGGGVSLQSIQQVEEKLKSLLKLNRASWEHMLFIPQASLAATIQRLKAYRDLMDPVHARSEVSASFDTVRFLKILEQRKIEYFKRWDRNLDMPERGRGIDDPWNPAGKILEAYYLKEKLHRLLGKVRELEKNASELTDSIEEKKGIIAEKVKIIAQYKPLVSAATQRAGLEAEKANILADGRGLKEVLSEWRNILAQMPEREQQLQYLDSDLKKLDEEFSIAQKRKLSEQKLEAHKRVTDINSQMARLLAEIAGMKDVPDPILDRVREIQKTISHARIQLASQEIKVQMKLEDDGVVHFLRPGHLDEEINLQAGKPSELMAQGSVGLRYMGLELYVKSGQVDVDKLMQIIASGEAELARMYLEEQVNDLASLTAKQQVYRSLKQQIETLQGNLSVILGGRTIEDWEEEIQQIQSLPPTRSITVIQQEQTQKHGNSSELKWKINEGKTKSARWLSEYKSPELLEERVVEMRFAWKGLEKQIQDLPSIPEGFENATVFIAHLHRRESEKDDMEKDLFVCKSQLQMIESALENIGDSVTDLEMSHAEAQISFQQAMEEGLALERIHAQAREIQEKLSADPFQNIHMRISDYTSRLTGSQYQKIEAEHAMPTYVVKSDVPYPTHRLSTGMLGSLALAVRLSYAEIYLRELDGFLLLDDPFTEMDEERRRLAADVLKEIAQEKQVILFTCHPQHQELFG